MKLNEHASNQPRSNIDESSNLEGGLSYKISDKEELYLRCATSFFGEKKYYTSPKEDSDNIVELVKKISSEDPEFILKLAYYCRNNLHLRTIPLVLLVEFANSSGVGSVKNARKYVYETIQRADELTEIISYQLNRNIHSPRVHSKIPMMIKNGVSSAFDKFDEYQFAKYSGKDSRVKLKDVVFLTRPNAKNPLISKIVNDNLKVPDTWEVKLSTWKNNYDTKKDAWESIIPKMGIMAITRNLRNFMYEGVPVDMYSGIYKNKNSIINSKMLPFRFFSAYKEIENVVDKHNVKNPEDVGILLRSLESAMDISVENLPHLYGNSFICVDLSGSMDSYISSKSSVTYKDISSLFGSTVNRMSEKSVVSGFASGFKLIHLNNRNGVLENAKKIRNIDVGCSTNAYKCMDYLLESGKHVDRIVLLSDMQCYVSDKCRIGCENIQPKVMKYKSSINPKLYFYSVDLSGYGGSLFPRRNPNKLERNISLISGWSDRIFEFINIYEKDLGEQIDYINNINF